MAKTCKQCGATLTQNCPVDDENFCEKKKVAVCPECDFVEMQGDYPSGCNFPKDEDEKK